MKSVLIPLILFLLVSLPAAAQDVRVTSSQLLIANGGRVTWGAKNNLLAFDQLGSNGFYDTYTSNPDGSNVTCLTCGVAALPPYSKGNPEWHPSNQFLAIQIQYSNGPFARDYTPGVGVNNDLYIADAAGKNYWPVTKNAPGVLHPRFSPDGTKLLWVQRTTGNNWNLMLGQFSVVGNVPQVTGVQSLPPCQNDVFCETGGFSTDGNTVFFTSDLDGQGEAGIDIYSYNLQTKALTNLTNSPDNWDEFPTSFPNAEKIIWMSGVEKLATGLQTDYWTMNYDGSNKVQLTYYNYQNAPSWYYGTAVSTAKFNWSPDGTQLAAYFIPNGRNVGQEGSIHIVNLEPAAPTLSGATYLRPPLAPDSIVSTFYSNLAIATTSAPSSALPTNLGGTSVSVTDSQNNTRSAPLFFTSPMQVNWVVPDGTAPGPATIQYTNSQNQSVRATVDVEPVDPGLFTVTATGAGPASAYLLLYPGGTGTPTLQNSFTCAATCVTAPLNLGASTDSAYLVLFGTGLRNASSVSVIVNGQTLSTSFHGAQGAFTGVDQVNVLLPHSLAGAGAANINLIADGIASNIVQIQIQ